MSTECLSIEFDDRMAERIKAGEITIWILIGHQEVAPSDEMFLVTNGGLRLSAVVDVRSVRMVQASDIAAGEVVDAGFSNIQSLMQHLGLTPKTNVTIVQWANVRSAKLPQRSEAYASEVDIHP